MSATCFGFREGDQALLYILNDIAWVGWLDGWIEQRPALPSHFGRNRSSSSGNALVAGECRISRHCEESRASRSSP